MILLSDTDSQTIRLRYRFTILKYRIVMAFKEYLHEKAEESRHNETLAYLMFVAGVIFFVGGILTTLSLTQEPQWFLLFPYFAETNAGAYLGSAMLISGILLAIFGIGACMYYSSNRGWYMQELRKAHVAENGMTRKSGRQKRTKKEQQRPLLS